MKRFDVLDRTTKISGNHFLEASAGTGKTFAIEHLTVRLIAEREIKIEEILIVTFTRAATRDLKKRIRRNLELALGSSAPFDYLQIFNEEQKRRLEEALICFDQAQIFTIHGFCHCMLSTFAFEAKVPFALKDQSRFDSTEKWEHIVKDTLRCDFDLEAFSSSQIEALFKKGDLKDLSQKIGSYAEKEIKQSRSFSSLFLSFQEALQNLTKGTSIEKEKVVADFISLSSCYKRVKIEVFMPQVEKLSHLLEKKACSREEFESLLEEKQWFLDKFRPDNLRMRTSLPSVFYPSLFEQIAVLLLPLLQEAKDPSNLFLLAAKAAQKRHLLQEEIDSPDQLLRFMDEAIKNPEFEAKITQKYKALVIDEFQDTDPLQWRIFHRFFSKMQTVCLVGDAKQSIYAFRNADVYTYLEAAESLGKESKSFLDTNYRSDPALIERLNRLFAQKWLHLPRTKEVLEYRSVFPRPGATNYEPLDGKQSVHIFMSSSEMSRNLEENKLFPFIAEEISKFKTLHQAVLVKDRFQALRLHHFLSRLHISSSIKNSHSVTQSKAFCSFKEIVEAVANPSDLSALKTALSSVLIGWEKERLQEGLESSYIQEAKRIFHTYNHLLKTAGFTAFFEELLRTKWHENTFYERLLSFEDLSLYYDLRHLAENLVKEKFCSLSALLLFFEQLFQKETKDFKRYPIIEEGSIEILTIHMSKGLEFDIVYALGLASRHLPEEKDLQKLEELDAEKMRQLYVALTRAKKRVYVPLVLEEGGSLALGEASPIELFCAHLQGEDLSYLERYEKIKTLSLKSLQDYFFQNEISSTDLDTYSSSPEKQSPPSFLKILAPSLEIKRTDPAFFLSFSLLAKSDSFSVPYVQVENMKTAHTLPLGKETGSILHEILEEFLMRKDSFDLQQKVAEAVKYTPLKGWERVLCEMVTSAPHIQLKDFCLSDVAPHQMQQEMPFLFPVGESFMKGFADLVFEKEGRYFILDWKSNWLGPSDEDYSLEKIEEAMQAHDYFLQAAIYTNALRRYLSLFEKCPFEEYFGGAIYVFLRGKKAYHFYPKEQHVRPSA